MFRPTYRVEWKKVRTVFGVVVALLFFTTAADAQIFGGKGLFNRKEDAPVGLTADQIGLPTPLTGRVEAVKGMEIQFELKAESKTPAAKVEFLIRTFPSAGKITSMTDHPTKRNVAVVTYYADPGSSAESDAFAFAVRYRGGRYSSAMRYDIGLGDVKSEISTDKEINFGEVSIGSSAEKEVTVRNLGKANFETTLSLAPPWYLVEPANGKLSLAGNGMQKVKVSFRPTLAGETSYFLSFARSKHGTTKLIGTGGEPFQLVTPQATLSLDEESGKRVGALVLQNTGVKPVRVLARASTRLGASLQKEYFLAPGRETPIKIGLQKTDAAPFDGMVQFYLESGLTKTAQVVAPVVPGSLQISIPDSATTELINFGQVKAGELAERAVVLTNPGGVAVPLEFHVPSPFRILNDPGPVLAPMGSVRIGIGLHPSVASKGPVDVTMNIYGNEQTLPLRLMGNILKSNRVASGPSNLPQGLPLGSMRMSAEPKNAANAGTSENSSQVGNTAGLDNVASNSSSTAVVIGSKAPVPVVNIPDGEDVVYNQGMTERQMHALRSPLGNIISPAVGREINLEIRRPEDLSVLKSETDTITLAWTAPKNPELYDFEVELSGMFDSGSGMPTHVWAPYNQVEINRVGRLVKAEIKNLLPKSAYEFRVFTIDENGKSSAASAGLHAETQPPMDWTYVYLIIALLCVIVLILGVIRIRKDREGEVYQAQYVDD